MHNPHRTPEERRAYIEKRLEDAVACGLENIDGYVVVDKVTATIIRCNNMKYLFAKPGSAKQSFYNGFRFKFTEQDRFAVIHLKDFAAFKYPGERPNIKTY